MKPRVFIFMEDGCVRAAIAGEEMDVIIIDRDIDGLEDDDIHEVLGADAYIYTDITSASVCPELAQKTLADVKKVIEIEDGKELQAISNSSV